ncbi:hypothetical protein FOMPIDRAFT_94414 [Fomitopsis schrenkii]|uniref:Uncharacterized protein n=1 Tax=Fomitopsis schrenkii TaxID=2126942 RepID=S8DJJ5_FOMSC|nr:hypothetical protein FOMPIDRAFT_94414 [Fomitopsis schrenkii]
MAPQRWTNEAQLELLESKTSSYIHHRNAHTLPRFRADLFREWFDQFPERGNLGADVQGPLTQQEAAALPAATWKRKERINNWFRNHNGQKGRRAVTGRVNLSILRPKGRRALQPVEVYSRKYYDERVKPTVDAAIEAGAVTEPSAKLNLVKRITREAYEADSDEVKAEIKDEVEALKSFCELLKSGVDPEGAEIDDVQRQAVIDNLPAIWRQILTMLQKWTGWYFLVVMAGEDGADDGKLRSMTYHAENSSKKYTYGSSTPDFKQRIVRPFLEYVKGEMADARAEREAAERSSSTPAEGGSSNDAEMTLSQSGISGLRYVHDSI